MGELTSNRDILRETGGHISGPTSTLMGELGVCATAKLLEVALAG